MVGAASLRMCSDSFYIITGPCTRKTDVAVGGDVYANMTLWSDRFLDAYFYLTQGRQHLQPDVALHVELSPSTSSLSSSHSMYASCKYSLKPRSQFLHHDEKNDRVRVTVISDTHGKHRHLGKLPAADLLIHCGICLHQ